MKTPEEELVQNDPLTIKLVLPRPLVTWLDSSDSEGECNYYLLQIVGAWDGQSIPLSRSMMKRLPKLLKEAMRETVHSALFKPQTERPEGG